MTRFLLFITCTLGFSCNMYAMKALLFPIDTRLSMQYHTQSLVADLIKKTPQSYRPVLEAGAVFAATASLVYAVAASIRGEDEFDVPMHTHKKNHPSKGSWHDFVSEETVEDTIFGLSLASAFYHADIFSRQSR